MNPAQFLGANWKPKVFGILAITAGVISQEPSLVNFLFLSVQHYVIGVAGLASAILAGAGLLTAKSGEVTGGTIGTGAAIAVSEAVKTETPGQVAQIGLTMSNVLYTLLTGSIPAQADVIKALEAAKAGSSKSLYETLEAPVATAFVAAAKAMGGNVEYLTWFVQGLELGFGAMAPASS